MFLRQHFCHEHQNAANIITHFCREYQTVANFATFVWRKIENAAKLEIATNLKPLQILKCRTFQSAVNVPFYSYFYVILTLYCFSYHILGNLGQSLGHEFYQAPNLAPLLTGSVLSNLNAVPDYRLRPILRILVVFSQDVLWCIAVFSHN